MKKWKIGLLGAVAMSAVMLVPVFLAGATPSVNAADMSDAGQTTPSEPLAAANPDYIAFQIGNRYGVKDHARYPLKSKKLRKASGLRSPGTRQPILPRSATAKRPRR